MQLEKTGSLSTQGDNKPMVFMADDRRKGAVWEITYGIEKLYLTDDEKEYFLDQVNQGLRWVEVNGYILTDKFTHIRPNQRLEGRALEDLKARRMYG